jgi:hypothetical protein
MNKLISYVLWLIVSMQLVCLFKLLNILVHNFVLVNYDTIFLNPSRKMCQREIRPQLELYVDLARTTGTREDNASHDSDKYSALLKIHQEKLGRNKSKSPTLDKSDKEASAANFYRSPICGATPQIKSLRERHCNNPNFWEIEIKGIHSNTKFWSQQKLLL